jgi:hypothetical protein
MNDMKFTTAGDYVKDTRCCGSGACIIDKNGECWCGQKWDGEKMAFPKLDGEQNERRESSTSK